MKKIIILFISLTLIACKEEIKTDYALFSGVVNNSSANAITVTGNNYKKEIKITDGVFADTLKIQESGYYSFKIGRESSAIHLAYGDNLNLTIDAKEFDESIKYTGEGSSKNNLLANKYMINEVVTGETKDFYAKEESDFIATAKKARAKMEDAINSSDVSSEFMQQQIDDAKYAYAAAMANYANNYHSYYGKKEGFERSEEHTSELQSP